MTDPAIEAAQRAEQASGWWKSGHAVPWDSGYAEDAAREALAPIRDLHRPFTRDYPGGDGRTVCNHCLGPVDWPCLTARLVYPENEL